MGLDIDRIQAICFDVDGTLRDTDDHWVGRLESWLHPVRTIFPERNPRLFARWIVMGLETPGNLIYEALDRLHLDDGAGRLLNVLNRRSRERNAGGGRFTLVPGVSDLLAGLYPRWPLAVVSARGAYTTRAFLQNYAFDSYFKAVATALTCTYTKPFPDPVIWAAGQMGVSPVNCLMVGDTTVDIRAGRASGAQTVGVLCGFGRRKELERAGADLILDNTSDLAEILGTKRGASHTIDGIAPT